MLARVFQCLKYSDQRCLANIKAARRIRLAKRLREEGSVKYCKLGFCISQVFEEKWMSSSFVYEWCLWGIWYPTKHAPPMCQKSQMRRFFSNLLLHNLCIGFFSCFFVCLGFFNSFSHRACRRGFPVQKTKCMDLGYKSNWRKMLPKKSRQSVTHVKYSLTFEHAR